MSQPKLAYLIPMYSEQLILHKYFTKSNNLQYKIESVKFRDFTADTVTSNTGRSLREDLRTPLELLPDILSSSHDHMQTGLPVNGLAQIIQDFAVDME